MLERDIQFLKQALENSRRSMEESNFPAGAVVVLNDEIIASEVSSKYPGLYNAQHSIERMI